MRTALPAFLLAAAPAPAADAVFQYAVPVTPAKGPPSTAFLWLPPAAKQVRGVVMAGMTLAEREMVKDPLVRKACADERLALVFLKAGLAAVDLQRVLDDLAKASGYRELAVAPLFFFGHSAGGPQAKAAAVKFADRCFGVAQYRGGHPGAPDPVPPGVPALMMLGQFDEFGKEMMRDEKGRENWEYGRDSLAAFRAADPKNLGSLVVEPGAGHFAWSNRNAHYLARYLRKAATARIPDWPADAKGPVQCKPVDPTSGWLTDLSLKPGGPKPAAHKDYAGDRAKAGWHFDAELAEATETYHLGLTGKKDQFIRWRDPVTVDAGARFFFNQVEWLGDGPTFRVHPEYAAVYPKQQSNGQGPRWPLAGKPVRHSTAPIEFRPVGGPVITAGVGKFYLRHDALAPATEPAGRVTFLAYSEGDEEYRYAEQVGMLPRGFAGLKEGKDQTITFPPVPDLRPGGDVELKATSDSGLPVEYHVGYGPAVIDGRRLRVAEVPARAAFPIEVKVVAYQLGKGVEPKVKTATPVERVLRVEKP